MDRNCSLTAGLIQNRGSPGKHGRRDPACTPQTRADLNTAQNIPAFGIGATAQGEAFPFFE
ncbi:MAG TPA: hypothetical protein DD643_04190 [Synechococcus sp. UBA8638]|nr:hypothetical protein [Synechococcus sp. UBA8638]